MSSCARTTIAAASQPCVGSICASRRIASPSAALPSGDQSLQCRAAGPPADASSETRGHRRLGQQRQNRRAVCRSIDAASGRSRGRRALREAGAPPARSRIPPRASPPRPAACVVDRFDPVIHCDMPRDIGVVWEQHPVHVQARNRRPRRPCRDRSRREAQRDPDRLLGRARTHGQRRGGSDARLIVITSADPESFCAGADLSELPALIDDVKKRHIFPRRDEQRAVAHPRGRQADAGAGRGRVLRRGRLAGDGVRHAHRRAPIDLCDHARALRHLLSAARSGAARGAGRARAGGAAALWRRDDRRRRGAPYRSDRTRSAHRARSART